MNEVISCAKQLADAITASSEYQRYQKNKALLETQDLLKAIPLIDQATAIIDGDKYSKTDKIYNDALEIIDKYKNNTIIDDYNKSKNDLGLLLDAVNGTLAHVTGMDTTQSKCGGCNGCKSK